jgi:hypothetical protein
MLDEPEEESFTLGAGVSPEIRKAVEGLEKSYRRSRLISTVITASAFTVIYALMTLVPDVTTVDILNGFIALTIVTIVVEVGHYYKLM